MLRVITIKQETGSRAVTKASNSVLMCANSDSTDDETDEEEEQPMKSILVELPEDQYEELKATKERNGFTWLGMLLHAQRCLYREQRE